MAKNMCMVWIPFHLFSISETCMYYILSSLPVLFPGIVYIIFPAFFYFHHFFFLHYLILTLLCLPPLLLGARVMFGAKVIFMSFVADKSSPSLKA